MDGGCGGHGAGVAGGQVRAPPPRRAWAIDLDEEDDGATLAADTRPKFNWPGSVAGGTPAAAAAGGKAAPAVAAPRPSQRPTVAAAPPVLTQAPEPAASCGKRATSAEEKEVEAEAEGEAELEARPESAAVKTSLKAAEDRSGDCRDDLSSPGCRGSLDAGSPMDRLHGWLQSRMDETARSQTPWSNGEDDGLPAQQALPPSRTTGGVSAEDCTVCIFPDAASKSASAQTQGVAADCTPRRSCNGQSSRRSPSAEEARASSQRAGQSNCSSSPREDAAAQALRIGPRSLLRLSQSSSNLHTEYPPQLGYAKQPSKGLSSLASAPPSFLEPAWRGCSKASPLRHKDPGSQALYDELLFNRRELFGSPTNASPLVPPPPLAAAVEPPKAVLPARGLTRTSQSLTSLRFGAGGPAVASGSAGGFSGSLEWRAESRGAGLPRRLPALGHAR
eukprot:TRINITY_DN102586_c0_g1_i1.p1 TRINITY_DN102586_c0_g1~~TRINITY_DN102586_c0_g1_i1.p1  ORF type:complete len:447 (-),score=99.40 TRINITY_DN102586_c0_g1_i1:194-1534(-)